MAQKLRQVRSLLLIALGVAIWQTLLLKVALQG